jgi:hypothetical protein
MGPYSLALTLQPPSDIQTRFSSVTWKPAYSHSNEAPAESRYVGRMQRPAKMCKGQGNGHDALADSWLLPNPAGIEANMLAPYTPMQSDSPLKTGPCPH